MEVGINPHDRLLRTAEVANLLGVHVMTVYKYVGEGSLIPVRIGNRSLRFRESEVQKWVERRAGK